MMTADGGASAPLAQAAPTYGGPDGAPSDLHAAPGARSKRQSLIVRVAAGAARAWRACVRVGSRVVDTVVSAGARVRRKR
jgi:hypothetical protein